MHNTINTYHVPLVQEQIQHWFSIDHHRSFLMKLYASLNPLETLLAVIDSRSSADERFERLYNIDTSDCIL